MARRAFSNNGTSGWHVDPWHHGKRSGERPARARRSPCVFGPEYSRASIGGRRRRRTIHRAPKPPAGLSSWGLQSPCQECVLRRLRKRQKWQVRKSTAWVTRQQPTKNGNSVSGGSSRDRKSSRNFGAIARRQMNEIRISRWSGRPRSRLCPDWKIAVSLFRARPNDYSRASRSKSSSTAAMSFCLRGSCAEREAPKSLSR
jgi:hypothetical protein